MKLYYFRATIKEWNGIINKSEFSIEAISYRKAIELAKICFSECLHLEFLRQN